MEYALINSDKTTNTTAQLVAASKDGILYTVNFDNYTVNHQNKKFPITRSYTNANDTTDGRFVERYKHTVGLNVSDSYNLSDSEPVIYDTSLDESTNDKINNKLYITGNFRIPLTDSVNNEGKMILNAGMIPSKSVTTFYPKTNAYGTSDGYVDGTDTRLNSPITSFSTLTNGNIVANSTNGCVELKKEKSEWKITSSTTPAITNAPAGTFKIIDNRDKPNGALLYVTRKNIGILAR